MIQILQKIRNMIDYPLRQMFRWERRGLRLKNEDKSQLYGHLSLPARAEACQMEQKYRAFYHLESFFNTSTVDNYCENLFYLEMLEKGMATAKVNLPDSIQVADIGSSSWFYVQALASFLKWWNTEREREYFLEGYEIDAFRVYQDLYSRYDHAIANIRQLKKVVYYPQGFKTRNNYYDLALMFFPFIFPTDHLEWGLPGGCFDPMGLLNQAWASLKTGGVLLVVNQGQMEFEAERNMIRQLGVEPATVYQHNSLFYSYEIPRFVQVMKKNG